MNDKYKYSAADGRGWLDMNRPDVDWYLQCRKSTEEYKEAMQAYNTRPNFEVHDDLKKIWEDGKIVEEGKDFKFEEACIPVGAFSEDWFQVMSPLPSIETDVEQLAIDFAKENYNSYESGWDTWVKPFIAGYNAALNNKGGGK